MIWIAAVSLLFFQGATAAQSGVLTGQLRTLTGAPAVDSRVSVIAAPSGATRPSDGVNYYSTQPPVSTAQTDKQGRYRLEKVPPGRYFIVSGATYYPSTLNADKASVVTVTPDSIIENLNFGLQTRLGGKVGGRLTPKASGMEKAILSGLNLEGNLEAPIGPEGTFEFGHVPPGRYWVDVVPESAGMRGVLFEVGDGDVTGLQIVRLPTYTVTGRIVVEKGPLPRAQLSFYTPQDYVGATINPDGTFTAQLHSASHRVELSGMPGGYSVSSVHAGSVDVSQGLKVSTAAVSNVVIRVGAPRVLPHVRGKVAGFASARLPASVRISGPIIGMIETPLNQDGTFDFAAVTPGMYYLTLPQVPAVARVPVVVGWNDADVQVVLP